MRTAALQEWSGVLSHEERGAISAFHATWEDVAVRAPDPLPELDVLCATPEWTRLRLASLAALEVFARRSLGRQEDIT